MTMSSVRTTPFQLIILTFPCCPRVKTCGASSYNPLVGTVFCRLSETSSRTMEIVSGDVSRVRTGENEV